jgi:hypothetical protein
LETEFKAQDRRFKVPRSAAITTATSYSLYSPGETGKLSLVLEVSLKGEPQYLAYGGTWHGDSVLRNTTIKVNDDKTSRPLVSGTAIVRAERYSHRYDSVDVTILYHPKDVPPTLIPIDLSMRERQILYVLASLKNKVELKRAYELLDIQPDEIQMLSSKKAIRPSGKGWKLTMSAQAARLESYVPEHW